MVMGYLWCFGIYVFADKLWGSRSVYFCIPLRFIVIMAIVHTQLQIL